MSTEIERRIVELEFQNHGFEKSIKESKKQIDELNKSLQFKGATKAVDDVNTAVKSLNLTSIQTAVNKIAKSFSELGVAGTAAMTRIANAAITTGKNIVSSLTIDPINMGLQEYETQMNAIQTILSNTRSKGSTLDDVNRALDALNRYSDQTIYNFTEMTRNIGTFTAAGVDLNTSVTAIQGIANLAAVSGSNATQASTAMYQLSQALASGTVKLMDWNSVVNAGMGGEIFKTALQETSRELGTGVDAAIAASGNFRDSLSKGWLTADVLTETLKKFTSSGAIEYVAKYTGLTSKAVNEVYDAAKAEYGEAEAIEEASKQLAKKSGRNQQEIKDILDFAKNAEDAATKVKTFSQLMSTLKESVQSGWSQTWRTVIGDFEEARDMFTSISNVMGNVIQKSADLRNAMLKVWKGLGGRTKLLEGLAKVSKSVLDIWDSIKTAFLDVFYITGKELYGITEQFSEFAKQLVASETTLQDIKRVVRGVASVLGVFGQIFTALVKGIVTVYVYLKPLLTQILRFGAIVGDVISIVGYVLKQTQIFNRLALATARILAIILELLENQGRIALVLLLIFFERIFAIVKLLVTLRNTINSTFGGLPQMIGAIFTALGKRYPVFQKFMDSIAPAFKNVSDSAMALGTSIKQSFGSFANFISSFGGAIQKALSAMFQEFSKMDKFSLAGIQKAFKAFGSTLENQYPQISILRQLIENLGTAIKSVFDNVNTVVGPVVSKIIGFIGSIFSTLFSKTGIAILFLGGIVAAMFGLLYAMTHLFEGFSKSVAKSISHTSDAISNYFKTLQQEAKSKQIKNLAESIFLMAAALMMLSFVDQKNLLSAALILGVFAASLMFLSAVLQGVLGLLTKKSIIDKVSMMDFSMAILGMAFNMMIIINAIKQIQEAMNEVVPEGGTSFIAALGILIGAFLIISTLATLLAIVTNKWAPSATKTTLAYILQLMGIVLAVKMLSKVSNLGPAIGALFAVEAAFLIMVAVLGIISKFTTGASAVKWGVLIGSALGIILLGNYLLKLSNVPWETIRDGLLKSIGIILAFDTVMYSARKAMGVKSSKVILAVAASFILLSGAMKILATMDAKEVARGTAGLLAMMVPLSVMLLIGRLGGRKIRASAQTIIAMAGTIALMSLCAALLSLLDPIAMIRGTAAIAVLSAVAGGIVALTRYVNKSKSGVKTISTMVVLIGMLTACVTIMSFIDTGKALIALAGISAVFLAMAVVFKLSSGLTGKQALGILAIAGVIAVIGGVLWAINQLKVETSIETVAGIALLMVAMAAVAKLISGIPVPAMLNACLGLILLGASLFLMLTVFSAIFGLFGDGEYMINGARILGETIGALVGGIMGGIAQGAAASLPAIGTSLSQFMENIQGFLGGAGELNASAIGSMFALVGLMTLMGITAPIAAGAAGFGQSLGLFGEGLSKFMTSIEDVDSDRLTVVQQLMQGLAMLSFGMILFSGSNLAELSAGLPDLGTNIATFCTNLGADISVEQAKKGAAIMEAVATAASKIPREGGWIGAIFGDIDISGFITAMGMAGPAIKTFHDSVTGLDSSNVTDGLDILSKTIDVASKIPNSGGWIGAIVGENDLDAFTAMMVSAGPDIKQFANDISGLSYADAENALDILKKTVDIATYIPNSGDSVAKWFVGDNTLDDFAKGMADAAPNIKTFITAFKGLGGMVRQADGTMIETGDPTPVFESATKAIDILSASVGIANTLTDEKVDNEALRKIAEDLSVAGPYLNTFFTSLEDIDASGDAMNTKASAIVSFMNGVSRLSGIKDTTLPDFTKLTGENSIYAFAEGMVNATQSESVNSKITASASNIMATLSNTFEGQPMVNAADMAVTTLKNKIVDYVNAYGFDFVSIGETIISDIGLAFIGEPIDKIAKALAEGLISSVEIALGVNSPSTKFKEIGEYVVAGLDLGIQNGTPEVKQTGSRMASVLENQFRDDLGIHSPSSVFEQLGTYIVDGLKNGLASGGSMQDIISQTLGGMKFDSFGTFGEDIKRIFTENLEGIDLSNFSIAGMEDGTFADSLLAKIQDQMDNEGLTADISAVFDADDLQAQINAATAGATGTISTSGTSGIAGSTMSSFVNTKFNDDQKQTEGEKNTFQFVQNNYSPKELDRIAIYRQTRNQFAAMKEVISKR